MDSEIVNELASEMGMDTDIVGTSLSSVTSQWTTMHIVTNATLAGVCFFVSILFLVAMVFCFSRWRKLKNEWCAGTYEEDIHRDDDKYGYLSFVFTVVWLASVCLMVFFIVQAVLYGVTPDAMFTKDALAAVYR